MIASLFLGLLLTQQAEPAEVQLAAEQTDVTEAEESQDEEMICRRRMVDSWSGRQQSVRTCKTREQWAAERRRSRR